MPAFAPGMEGTETVALIVRFAVAGTTLTVDRFVVLLPTAAAPNTLKLPTRSCQDRLNCELSGCVNGSLKESVTGCGVNVAAEKSSRRLLSVARMPTRPG